jgi:hypothetical protein
LYDLLTLSCSEPEPAIRVRCPNCNSYAVSRRFWKCPREGVNLSAYVAGVFRVSFPELSWDDIFGKRPDLPKPTTEELSEVDAWIIEQNRLAVAEGFLPLPDKKAGGPSA